MTQQHRTEADFQTFLLGLTGQPDDVIVSMAVTNRAIEPKGPFGERTRAALTAEAERRGLGLLVVTLANAAIAQGKTMVGDEGGA